MPIFWLKSCSKQLSLPIFQISALYDQKQIFLKSKRPIQLTKNEKISEGNEILHTSFCINFIPKAVKFFEKYQYLQLIERFEIFGKPVQNKLYFLRLILQILISDDRGDSDGSKNICLNKFANAKMFTTANKRFSRIWQVY